MGTIKVPFIVFVNQECLNIFIDWEIEISYNEDIKIEEREVYYAGTRTK